MRSTPKLSHNQHLGIKLSNDFPPIGTHKDLLHMFYLLF